jgi:hypothetical protein
VQVLNFLIYQSIQVLGREFFLKIKIYVRANFVILCTHLISIMVDFLWYYHGITLGSSYNIATCKIHEREGISKIVAQVNTMGGRIPTIDTLNKSYISCTILVINL